MHKIHIKNLCNLRIDQFPGVSLAHARLRKKHKKTKFSHLAFWIPSPSPHSLSRVVSCLCPTIYIAEVGFYRSYIVNLRLRLLIRCLPTAGSGLVTPLFFMYLLYHSLFGLSIAFFNFFNLFYNFLNLFRNLFILFCIG